jgi:hypothetical protein
MQGLIKAILQTGCPAGLHIFSSALTDPRFAHIWGICHIEMMHFRALRAPAKGGRDLHRLMNGANRRAQ